MKTSIMEMKDDYSVEVIERATLPALTIQAKGSKVVHRYNEDTAFADCGSEFKADWVKIGPEVTCKNCLRKEKK